MKSTRDKFSELKDVLINMSDNMEKKTDDLEKKVLNKVATADYNISSE